MQPETIHPLALRQQLREEAIIVEIAPGTARSGDPKANSLAGNVRRCSFLGNILRYAVDVNGAAPITVDLQNAAGVAPLPVGAPVVLRWPVADSLILAGER